jgi:PEP-CTERM motif
MRLKLLLLSFALLMLPLSAFADTVYTYTGNTYTFNNGDIYNPSGHISGSFALASPLGDNETLEVVNPISFTFTDGTFTLTKTTVFPLFAASFEIETDASGNITAWNIGLQDIPFHYIFTENIGPYVEDYAVDPTAPVYAYAGNMQDAGTWTSSAPSPVPEPSTILLFGTGILGTLGLLRKRQAFNRARRWR